MGEDEEILARIARIIGRREAILGAARNHFVIVSNREKIASYRVAVMFVETRHDVYCRNTASRPQTFSCSVRHFVRDGDMPRARASCSNKKVALVKREPQTKGGKVVLCLETSIVRCLQN